MKYLTYIYYALMATSFAISVFVLKKEKRIWPLVVLVFFSMLTEAAVEVYKRKGLNHFVLYHYFTPLEYILTAFFLYFVASDRLKKVCLASILLFIGIFAALLPNTDLNSFPEILNTIESLFLIMLSTFVLLGINIKYDVSIYRLPTFWFAAGILLYWSSTFFFNGIYEKIKVEHSAVAQNTFTIINSVANWLFYLFFIFGFTAVRKGRGLW